ncbi:MAG: hypothetical protein J6C00_03585 [Eubacterium sp.]|nr:hypothetical protein [Eubacterium sp.]
MQFSNKLNFLMNITNTSNKELAEAISVDRSLISLLRSGKRKTPRNHDHIRHMASFFARRCSADFQFHALAEMLEKPELRSSTPTETLVDYLYQWMLGDKPVLERLLENVSPIPPAPNLPPEGPLTHPSMPSEGLTQFFYGNEGKREATRYIINIAKQLDKASPIYFVSDVNLEWLFEDYQFMSEFSAALSAIFQKGFTLYHIMPSLNFMNRYVESLRYWLPIYATGNARVYYYPRLRDNLYRRSLIIIPGYCVQASTCIGNASNLMSLFSTDQELVNAYNDQFQYELSLCRPALVSHTDPNEFITCFRELLNDNSPVIHKASKPSPYTLPTECLDAFINETPESTWRTTLQMDLADASLFEEKLSRSSCIELCPLATPEDVRAGKILFGTDYKVADKHPVYTPEIYAMHLQHILDLMDKYENYHFVPVTPTDRQDYNLFASESGPTLLVSNSSPFYMLEIRRPELSHACYEYLMRQADLVGYEGIRRAKIRMQIRELIQELRQ